MERTIATGRVIDRPFPHGLTHDRVDLLRDQGVTGLGVGYVETVPVSTRTNSTDLLLGGTANVMPVKEWHRRKSEPFLRWATRSLVGQLVLYHLTFAIPMSLFSFYKVWSQGLLTFEWALYTYIVASAGAAFVATVIWYTMMRPLIRSRTGRK